MNSFGNSSFGNSSFGNSPYSTTSGTSGSSFGVMNNTYGVNQTSTSSIDQNAPITKRDLDELYNNLTKYIDSKLQHSVSQNHLQILHDSIIKNITKNR